MTRTCYYAPWARPSSHCRLRWRITRFSASVLHLEVRARARSHRGERWGKGERQENRSTQSAWGGVAVFSVASVWRPIPPPRITQRERSRFIFVVEVLINPLVSFKRTNAELCKGSFKFAKYIPHLIFKNQIVSELFLNNIYLSIINTKIRTKCKITKSRRLTWIIRLK